MSSTEHLTKEIHTFEEHRQELLEKAKDEFVLIHGDEVVSTFKDRTDAIREGYQKFGNQPFLVKQVEEVELPANFTSQLLAV